MKTIGIKLSHPRSAFTLIEMTIVIMILLGLAGSGLYSYAALDRWKLGRAASEDLRSVYSAQRMYLADNPITPVADLTEAMLIPYLPNRAAVPPATLVAAFQPIKAITGANLGFRITQSPPVLVQGAVVYDPSGRPTDSLWDVGQ
jgi:prepilin-type N-terminal cleavage/methylation domain-containing protein